jgi:thiol:disulfide interchange protein DsbD
MTSRRRRDSTLVARLLAGAALLALATGAVAAAVKSEHVEAELVAARTAIVPGEPFTVALRLKIQDGWHTYWRNPGDSGLPTTLTWTLPEGIAAGPIEWPAPRALPAGPLVNYGYEGDALHLVELKPSGALVAGSTVSLKARADWLVCRELCIPEGADLTLALPVAREAGADPRWGAAIAAARAALPRPLGGWRASGEARGATIALTLVPAVAAANPGEVRFFPYAADQIEPSGAQRLTREGDAYVLALPVASTLSAPFDRLAGVLTASGGFGTAHAATIEVALAGTAIAGPKPALAAVPALNLAPPSPAASAGFFALTVAIVSALVGGVILNLMPCVFPILSLKVLGFATHHDTKPTLRHEAVAFAGGVVATFVALGLLLAALRAGGEQLGWGFQLQSPEVVAALAMLFFVLALNLSGVFEFGQLAPSGVAGWTTKNRTVDAFGSGVLAVVVASPCTAPFMGAALGFAMASPAATMLAVFVALGIGMALPYMLLAWFPGWRRRLPRPGPWLERLRQILAFPLYATVIWLAWVLGAQRDNDAVVRLLVALLGIGFALWAWRIVRSGGGRPWGIAAVLALAASTLVAWPLFAADSDVGTKPVAAAPADRDWVPYTPAKLAELTASGRGVFVEFTAAWCVTCQVNKRLVLDKSDVRAAFARRNVTLMRADWTRRDPAITRALAALGRNGVPVYVLYRPGKEPLLLPEVLQPGIVLDGLATL